jgi:hypothetical protein
MRNSISINYYYFNDLFLKKYFTNKILQGAENRIFILEECDLPLRNDLLFNPKKR